MYRALGYQKLHFYIVQVQSIRKFCIQKFLKISTFLFIDYFFEFFKNHVLEEKGPRSYVSFGVFRVPSTILNPKIRI